MRQLTDNRQETVRDHLMGVAERGNPKALAMLQGPELPEVLEYLWRWWEELDFGRGQGFSGPARLTWRDIEAWAALTDRDVTRMEAQALLRMDLVVLYPDPKKSTDG